MNGRIRWRERYNVLGILLAIHLISYMDRKAIFLVLPLIAREFHMSPLAMGLVSSIFSAGYALAQIPGGMLADRFGIRRVASLALLWWSVFIGLTGAVGTYVQLLVTRFCFGLGEGVYPACEFKAIANWFPKGSRATATAAVFAFGDIGRSLAPAVVLSIAAYWGWRSAFLALFIPGVIMAVVFWMFVAEAPARSKRVSAEELAETDEADSEVQQDAGAASVRKLGVIEALRQQHVLAWFFIIFAFSIVSWAFPVWLPTYLLQGRGFSIFEMGLASTLSSIAAAAGSMSCGWLSDRHFSDRRHVLIIASQLLSAASVLLMIYAGETGFVILGATLAGFFIAFFSPAFWAMPMVALSKRSLGVSSGIINMGGQIGGLLGPIITGLALQLTGTDFVVGFWVQVVAALISCAITVATFSRLRTRRREGTVDVARDNLRGGQREPEASS